MITCRRIFTVIDNLRKVRVPRNESQYCFDGINQIHVNAAVNICLPVGGRRYIGLPGVGVGRGVVVVVVVVLGAGVVVTQVEDKRLARTLLRLEKSGELKYSWSFLLGWEEKLESVFSSINWVIPMAYTLTLLFCRF